MSEDRFRDLVADLAELDDADAFARLCHHGADVLPVSGTGISLIIDEQHRGCLGASNDVARHIEELQFRVGEGPCLDAHRTGLAVIEAHLEGATRWPLFTPDALGKGVAAIYAMPLRVGSASFGALDLYRDRPGLLTPAMLAEAQRVADLATAMVLDLRAGAPDGLPALVEELFAHRVVIHQATGMASVQLGTSVTEALVAIRARAYSTDQTVGAVARAIVERTLRLEP